MGMQSQNARRGYPALARLMGPYTGMAMYKRFGVLNAHSLLLQQAELLDLEQQFDLQAAVDRSAGLNYDEKALNLLHSPTHSDKQWQLAKSVRERLKDYSEMRCQVGSGT